MKQYRIAVISALTVFAIAGSVLCQELAAQAEESELSRILKTSGSLLLRESHYLPDVAVVHGNDIKCRVLVVRNLLEVSGSGREVYVGFVLAIEEEYSERSAYVDPDEIEAFIASIEYIQQNGTATLTQPMAGHTRDTRVSSEIHYTTKDGTVLAAILSGGKLLFGLRVSNLADWVFLTDAGVSSLLSNLQAASEIVSQF